MFLSVSCYLSVCLAVCLSVYLKPCTFFLFSYRSLFFFRIVSIISRRKSFYLCFPFSVSILNCVLVWVSFLLSLHVLVFY